MMAIGSLLARGTGLERLPTCSLMNEGSCRFQVGILYACLGDNVGESMSVMLLALRVPSSNHI